MSSFSECLKAHMDRRKMSTSELSRLSGIEYSFLHRITTGKRFPAKLQTVERLGQLLSLTPEEQEDLRIQYDITRVGPDVYHRRQSVRRMLEEIRFPTDAKETLPAVPAQALPASCDGRLQVEGVTLQILTQEAQRTGGVVRLLAQPGLKEAFPLRLLRSFTLAFPSLTVNHILCFDNRAEMEYRNVDIFSPLIPTLFSTFHYHAYYFYGDHDTLFGRLSLFPNLLLTSGFALLMSPDYCSALCFPRGSDSYQVLDRRFSDCFQNCYPLSMVTPKLPALQSYFAPPAAGDEVDHTFLLSHTFFGLPLLTGGLCGHLLKQNLPDRSQAMEDFLNYLSSLPAPNRESTCYFTSLEGIRAFLDSGLLLEFPVDTISPLPMEDRLFLVRRLLSLLSAEEGVEVGLRLCRTDQLLFSPSLKCLCRQNLSRAELILCHPRQGLISVSVQEPMIAAALTDYFDSILDSRYTLSPAESARQVAALLSEYQ